MFELLLLIIGCYGVAALLVHLVFWARRGRNSDDKHYVLIADHGQHNLEWYLRRLFLFSRWIGKDVRLTVVDNGISEESKGILSLWTRKGEEVRIHVHREQTERADDSDGEERLQTSADKATQMLWALQTEGIVGRTEHAVLIDLQDPKDLSKMPF